MSSLARTRPTGAAPSRRLVGVVRAALYGPNVKHGTDARAERASIGTTACVSGFGVAFNQRCDVAWLLGLGKRAETLPKKGSIPSHGATIQCCCIRDRPECIETLPDNDHIAAVRFKVTGRVRLARQTGEPTSSASSAISIASSNTTSVGFRHPLLATLYAATQTIGVNRAPSLEMVIGVAAPFNAAFLAEPNPHLRKHANKHGQQTGAANMRASREKFARVAGNAQAIPASNAAPFHSARLTPRAPSPAAAGIFYPTGQHVRIVTTARNCSASSAGGSRVLMAVSA